MDAKQEQFLNKKAGAIRREVLSVAVTNGAGHIAPSLSCVEILVALYYDVMQYRAGEPHWAERDRLIFSKSHGCYGLYAILADLGVLPAEEWKRFYRPGCKLSGCAERNVDFGLEAGCGSLGHGLPLAAGLALGAKLQKRAFHTFCVVGDGELQEGTNWEAIQFAVKHGLGNLTIIVDKNDLQAMDFIVNVLDRDKDDLLGRLSGFGLHPEICAGHEAAALAGMLRGLRERGGDLPNLLVAETTKGFGVACMENVAKFHFRIPSEDELKEGAVRG